MKMHLAPKRATRIKTSIVALVLLAGCGLRSHEGRSASSQHGIRQEATYAVQEIALPDGYSYVELHKMNNLGSFVGTLQPRGEFLPPQPFVWNGDYTMLSGLPGTRGCYASGINDDGVIVGGCDDDTVVWRKGEPTLLFQSSRERNSGASINSGGQIVGTFNLLVAWRAYLWNGSVAVLLPTSGPECQGNGAVAINDLGEVAGVERCSGVDWPVMWRKGEIIRLDRRPAATNDLNNVGDVVGTLAQGSGAAIRWYGGESQILSSDGSGATGINNVGEIVGGYPATLWFNGEPIDLNTRVDAPGLFLTTAFAVNDNGQIIALAYRAGSIRIALLTPEQ